MSEVFQAGILSLEDLRETAFRIESRMIPFSKSSLRQDSQR